MSPPQSISSTAQEPNSDRLSPPGALDPYDRPNDLPLLAVIGFAHFFNDFCLGITSSMIPAMEVKFAMTLGQVAGIVTIMSVVGNLFQPIAGLLLDRSRTVRILFFTPLFVGGTTLLGLTTDVWQARVLFLVAGLALGAFHPYAFVLAQSSLPRRPALATSVFVSFGFGGLSLGSMVSGFWMQYRGFTSFHFFYLVAFLVIALLFARKAHKIDLPHYRAMTAGSPRATKGDSADAASIPFGLLFLIGVLIGIEGVSLSFFLPKLFKMLYDSEGLGGTANFILGLLGGLSSYYYAYRADRGNVFKVALVLQIVGWAPLVGFFFVSEASAKIAMVVMIGLTMSAIFPLIASLSPRARGLTLGLRTAFMFGGVWGTASVLSFLMAQLPDRGYELESVMGVVRFIPFALIPILAYASRRYVT